MFFGIRDSSDNVLRVDLRYNRRTFELQIILDGLQFKNVKKSFKSVYYNRQCILKDMIIVIENELDMFIYLATHSLLKKPNFSRCHTRGIKKEHFFLTF